MSGRVVGWAMEHTTGSPAAKLVLVKLADNANEDGFCWPSVALIVRHTELAQSTVYKHLTDLEARGLLEVVPRLTGYDASGEPEFGKAYQLAIPAEWAIPQGGKIIPPNGRAAPRRGKQIPPSRTPYKEGTSKEPSLNHGGARPRAPDGAAVAAALGDPGRTLLARLGPAQVAAWFDGAWIEAGPPARVMAASEMQANWIRNKFGSHLDAALPGGWEVVAQRGGNLQQRPKIHGPLPRGRHEEP